MSEDDERSFHFNKRPDKTIVSKRIQDAFNGPMRIASKVIDVKDGLAFAHIRDEIVLRTTPKGRHEIKATFIEDNRGITVLTIQKFNNASGPCQRTYFSFVGQEINTLLKFIVGIKSIQLSDGAKQHVFDDELEKIILSERNAQQIFAANEELFLRIAANENLKRDFVAIGYRRKQLEHFERLLNSSEFFNAECARLRKSPEAVWQGFFETNTWIFGYGLSYIFLSPLDKRRLEQAVRGPDIAGVGKRADALMKTRAIISSLCFVEIKRHDTSLLARTPYRSSAWPPSSDLAGGVAQVQATIQEALESLGSKVALVNDMGDPTGETVFNIQPHSILIAGKLSEFETAFGVNEQKFRSFEMYRRNTQQPEILTFDELLHRARFIVEHHDLPSASADDKHDLFDAPSG